MQVRRIHHTGFTVASLDRSLAFYRDVLGFDVVAQQFGTADYLGSVTGFPGLQMKLAFVKASGEDDHILELLEYVTHPGEPNPPETNRPGNGHICIVVDNIHASYRELRDQGVWFVNEPTLVTSGVNRGAYEAYFRDPDGFSLELYQAAPA
jgi:lactoylglutathione lyase